ncbi:MAG: cytochrome c3 family protein [Saprospiraceae bacterium]
MHTRILFLLLFTWLYGSTVQAQLSPGDLTKAHADLEGMFNCTQCHSIGNKIDDQKCLDCHDEIQTLVNQRKGYHGSREVRGKDCATCHSEHHGRKFDMVRFDQDNFDHDLTGYELAGAHNRIECRECHIPEFIADSEIKKLEDTFLGLQHDCVSCHEDVHQNTLSTNDCASCHSTEEFAPADFFDHDDTEYPLKGKHVEVDCIECHQKEMRNGKEFQRFADVEFTNCNSCHDDVHENNLGTNCKQCHSEDSFTSMRRIRRYNHNQTNFPLKGAHQRVKCVDCHDLNTTLTQIFQDLNGIQTNDCISCHEDVHDNKFGTNCAECHNEESFFNVSTDGFNHDLTGFALVGQHRTVDCRECHTTNLTDPIEHSTCTACHTDYHEGEFAVNGVSPDCVECHNEDGFAGSSFTVEQHNESNFPLTGAHLATPCLACHLADQDDRWTFRNIGERCVDCHDDVHEGFIAAEFYPQQDCEQCHVTDDWVQSIFDHNRTEFELLGKHAEVACMDCHGVEEATAENRYAGFVDTPNACAECHDDTHDGQFVVEEVNDCARCHGFDNWEINDFNHDNTAFILEGAHVEVDCAGCHQPMTASDGSTIIQYKFNSFECIDCHQ